MGIGPAPAIRRAFDEDRVDTMIVDFDSVQREFDLPGAPPLLSWRNSSRMDAPEISDRRNLWGTWERCAEAVLRWRRGE